MANIEKQPRNMVPVDTAAIELTRQLDLLSGRAFREGKMELAGALQQAHTIVKPAVAKLAPQTPDPRQTVHPATVVPIQAAAAPAPVPPTVAPKRRAAGQ